MHYVYILELKNKTYYVGYSINLKMRIKAHNSKSVSTTKKLLPAKLIFYASFLNKNKALSFEKYLKSSSGHAFRKKRLL